MIVDVGPVCTRCGKVVYRRRRTANRKLKMLQRVSRKGHRFEEGPIDAYQCPAGNGWHIGHRRNVCTSDPSVIVRIGSKQDANHTQTSPGSSEDYGV